MFKGFCINQNRYQVDALGLQSLHFLVRLMYMLAYRSCSKDGFVQPPLQINVFWYWLL